jgi:hypothetical protein
MSAVNDAAFSAHIPVTSLLRHGAVPIERTSDGVLVARDPAAAQPVPADWFPDEPLRYRRLDRATVQSLILATRPEDVADEMANGFTRRHPQIAVRTGVAGWQRVAAVGLGLALLATLATGHGAAAMAVASAVFCASVLLRTSLAVAGGTAAARPPAPVLPDADLPTCTVLVPAYQEAAVVGDTIRCIAELDYPADRLEVLVLVEQDDEATADAVRAVDPPSFVRIVPLPPGPPQTKPRAVNLGLLLAAGELLVIFDAEDRPERDQLRKVAEQFAAGGPRLACVQARLNFYNGRRNVLTRLFSLEYAFQYDLMLPGLARFGLPVPLGGTSNYLRTEVLRQVGGWDAWNVTEDADLGMRLASAGYRVEVADSTTWEECPARAWPWVKQRTRWLKGFLLTILVHTRQPLAASRRFGGAGMATLLGVVAGNPLAYLLWPLALPAVAVGGPATRLAATAMWAAALLMAGATAIAARRRRLPWAATALLPLYWLLHACAGWRAVAQLVRSPYNWEKTTHWAQPGAPATASPDLDGLPTAS